MPGQPLARDTTSDVEARQIEAWQRMTPADKLAIVAGLSRAVFDLGLAGVRDRYPAASHREHFLRLAIQRFGRDLAAKVYPEIDALNLE